MKFDLSTPIAEIDRKYTLVAFDTETSGPYAIESEVVELGAVKWQNGKIVDKFSTLLKPSKEMTPDNIRIHGITNEMVKDSPKMSSEIIKFCDFIEDSILVAHHAPFDLGFVAIDIEANNLKLPNTLNLCSSLISRALLHTTNHKLQTLVKELNLIGGDAHRAYDDAYACLQVLFKSMEKLDSHLTLQKLLDIQGKDLSWKNYQVAGLNDSKVKALLSAMRMQKMISIVYEGGQTKNKTRPIRPLGIVRNPDGDYISAECGIDFKRKRFYLDKIKEVELI